MSDEIEGMPKALASELQQGLNFAVLDKLLRHRRAYLERQLSAPKKRRECQRVWGQIEEVRWLRNLRLLTENTLKA